MFKNFKFQLQKQFLQFLFTYKIKKYKSKNAAKKPEVISHILSNFNQRPSNNKLLAKIY